MAQTRLINVTNMCGIAGFIDPSLSAEEVDFPFRHVLDLS
jgi:hypothetical protein